MRTSRTRALPARLEGLRRRFERWRRTRRIGSRIPEGLWEAAVEAAKACGLHPTAKALGLDYYSLKKRLEEKPSSGRRIAAPPSGPRFVELSALPTHSGIPECTLQLENANGSKMRIEVKGIDAEDLAAISRSLWGTV